MMSLAAEELLARGQRIGWELGLEKGIEQGIEQGIKQGQRLGREEGQAIGLRMAVKQIMSQRFGEQAARRFAQIDAADLPKLQRWFERAIDGADLDAIFTELH